MYISGTDFNHKTGELGSIGSNLGISGGESSDKIDDMSPYPRLVAESLNKEKYLPMIRLFLLDILKVVLLHITWQIMKNLIISIM